jgi:CheY-like chemotaxis protein
MSDRFSRKPVSARGKAFDGPLANVAPDLLGKVGEAFAVGLFLLHQRFSRLAHTPVERVHAEQKALFDEVARLERLGVQVQQIARVLVGEQPAVEEPFDLSAAVNQILTGWLPTARRKGVALQGPQKPLMVMANPAVVEQLMDLALDHSIALANRVVVTTEVTGGVPHPVLKVTATRATDEAPSAIDGISGLHWSLLSLLGRAFGLSPERISAEGEVVITLAFEPQDADLADRLASAGSAHPQVRSVESSGPLSASAKEHALAVTASQFRPDDSVPRPRTNTVRMAREEEGDQGNEEPEWMQTVDLFIDIPSQYPAPEAARQFKPVKAARGHFRGDEVAARVLIVEPMDGARARARQILLDAGYAVDAFGAADEALACARAAHPDVLVSGLRVELHEGAALVQAVRLLQPRLRVIELVDDESPVAVSFPGAIAIARVGRINMAQTLPAMLAQELDSQY